MCLKVSIVSMIINAASLLPFLGAGTGFRPWRAHIRRGFAEVLYGTTSIHRAASYEIGGTALIVATTLVRILFHIHGVTGFRIDPPYVFNSSKPVKKSISTPFPLHFHPVSRIKMTGPG